MINLFKSKTLNQQRFSDPTLNMNCSEFEINKWIISDFVLKKLVSVAGTHPFPLDELMLMSSTVAHFRPKYIFEWGTHIGKSARIFYETIKAFDISCHIHSIDLPDDVEHVEHPKHKRGQLVQGLKEVTLNQGDGISTAMEIYKTLSGEPSVLFFVDGDHEYESVKRELEIILQQVKKPAILLHDTYYQSEEANYNIGPYRAIQDTIRGKEKLYKLISVKTGLPGMTLIFQR